MIDLKRSGLRSREEELIRSYEELFSSHQLFAKTCWPHNEVGIVATFRNCNFPYRTSLTSPHSAPCSRPVSGMTSA